MTETATIANVLGSELSLEELWMPFTANRAFKRAPRLLASASGMYYTTVDGRRVLDGTAGLWCVNAGHCREPIVRAVQEAAATLDFAPGLPDGASVQLRARGACGGNAAGRSRPRVLRELRVGGGRLRAQDRAGVFPVEGRDEANALRGTPCAGITVLGSAVSRSAASSLTSARTRRSCFLRWTISRTRTT